MFLLLDSENSVGGVSIMKIDTRDHGFARGWRVTAEGVITDDHRGARRKTWIAFFETFEELAAARALGGEAFNAHEAKMAAARAVLRDATEARRSDWLRALKSAPGATPL